MRERPILFSAPMVRAILDGRKTVTRRIVKCPTIASHWVVSPERDGKWWPTDGDDYVGDGIACPYGAIGDRLWVRETFCIASGCPEYGDEPTDGRPRGPMYVEDGHEYARAWAYYRASDSDVINTADEDRSPWKPSIFMPRWASRITLEVTGVRIERLHDITEEQAKAEGVERDTEPCDHTRLSCEEIGCMGPTYRSTFAGLWMAINGEDSWEANPWVWCVEFERVESPWFRREAAEVLRVRGESEREGGERP